MSKIIEVIKVGFEDEYGDIDWSISCSVENMSLDKIEALLLGMVHAQRVLWDTWCQAQHSPIGQIEAAK